MGIKKEKFKVEITIWIQSLKDIPKTNIGNDFYIKCKRGKKSKNEKETKTVTSKESICSIDEKLKWECTFFKDPKTQKIEPKKEILFILREQKIIDGKKSGAYRTIGNTLLGLNQYANPGTIRMEILPFQPEKKKESGKLPSLVLKIESQLTKSDSKTTTKISEISSRSNSISDFNKIEKKNTISNNKNSNEEITETNASLSNDNIENLSDGDDAEEKNEKNQKEKEQIREKKKADIEEKKRKFK
jgi:hypothetical protein